MAKSSSKFVKQLRKWSRIIHRDLGFFFFGISIIYGLSGIAINHLDDWNPNYSVSNYNFSTEIEFTKDNAKDQIATLIDDLSIKEKYKSHFFPDKNTLRIYLTSSSTIYIDIPTGTGQMDILKRRPIFYQTNYLHYNPNKWWTWFSDAFAIALILFALTSLFMVRGKKGAFGRGGIYIILGVLIPILILIFT